MPGVAERVAWPSAADRPGKSAVLSTCGSYRYALFRIWDPDKPLMMFVGLNPSTADAYVDDKTTTRCIGFARDCGYGGLILANLYAWRATKPRKLLEASDPVGAKNDAWLRQLRQHAGVVIAAWGAWPGPDPHRPAQAMDLIGGLHVLGLTAKGDPRHPLYMPKTARPTRWTWA